MGEVKVLHIMKDGSVKQDITGHVVKMSDAPNIYNLMDTINSDNAKKRGAYEEEKSKKQGA